VLHARSDAGDDQSNAEARKSAWKGHHQISRSRHESRQRQRHAWTEPGDQPVARNLQATHGAIIEGPNHRETGVRESELRLPDRQQSIKLIRVAVVQQMSEASTRQIAPLW
jgi:hypothetical protein